MKCTVIAPIHHQTRRHGPPNIEDVRQPSPCKIGLATWTLPLSAGQPAYGIHDLGFVPSAITVRNYSDQPLYLATSIADATSTILSRPELIIPARVVYNAPFGLRRTFDKNFAWNLPGTSYGRSSLILAYIYECEEFLGDEIYTLPPDLSPNAIESYEKSSTIVAGLTPGGSLAAGATDVYQLAHRSVDLTVAADAQPMQFKTGPASGSLTNAYTLMAGEKLSLGANFGYVTVTNLGAAAGGYRILNLYESQTL